MATLYVWLKFIHILSVGTFLFVHGVAGGVAFVLREPVSTSTRSLLRLSRVTSQASYPLLLLVIITGVWMTFAGNWGHMVWPWAALAILILAIAFMAYIARPYYVAREATKEADDVLSARLKVANPGLAAGVGVVALVLLFALMVFKPF